MRVAPARTGIFNAVLLLSLTAAMPSAPAAVITNGCANVNVSCTFVELLGGATIQTNDLVFGDFSPIHVLGFGYARIPDLRNIVVYGLDDGGLDPGPGLLFDLGGQWNLGPRGLIDYETSFTVTSFGNVIKDSSLDLGAGTSRAARTRRPARRISCSSMPAGQRFTSWSQTFGRRGLLPTIDRGGVRPTRSAVRAVEFPRLGRRFR
ncbi:MAG: hypothetical protein R2748_27240 [Bryobacterales bacterium]